MAHNYKRDRCVVSYDGMRVRAGFPDGVMLSSGYVYLGCTAFWMRGQGDKTRRETIMTGKTGVYCWADRAADVADDIASLLQGSVVDDVQEAMTARGWTKDDA
jgi:hypothetical protein